VLRALAAWLRGDQAQRRALRKMLRHQTCILPSVLLRSLPGVDFVLSRVIQLLPSVLEYAGAVYARNHGLRSPNGSFATQPLTLIVPGSCWYE
jgi:hypothetical protein